MATETPKIHLCFTATLPDGQTAFIELDHYLIPNYRPVLLRFDLSAMCDHLSRMVTKRMGESRG